MIKEVRVETVMVECATCHHYIFDGKPKCLCGSTSFYEYPVCDVITGEYIQMMDSLNKESDGPRP